MSNVHFRLGICITFQNVITPKIKQWGGLTFSWHSRLLYVPLKHRKKQVNKKTSFQAPFEGNLYITPLHKRNGDRKHSLLNLWHRRSVSPSNIGVCSTHWAHTKGAKKTTSWKLHFAFWDSETLNPFHKTKRWQWQCKNTPLLWWSEVPTTLITIP